MKKRLISLTLALCMLLSVVPMPAKATSEHIHHDVTFTGTAALPTEEGSYYLTEDVTLSAAWTVPSGVVTLCLNGHKLDLNGNHIMLQNGATLNVYDCDTTTVRYFDVNDGLWTLKTDGTSEHAITGGIITGGSSHRGGVIEVKNATLNLYGGTLVGNHGAAPSSGGNGEGGAVFVNGNNSSATSKFIMHGGAIVGNKADTAGGAVIAYGTFEMKGGTIRDNTAGKQGGGVYVAKYNTEYGDFTMDGGTIQDNTATTGEGGGVYCADHTSFVMNSGTISGNRTLATYKQGGGVYLAANSTFTMNNGTISGNSSADAGGGVSVFGSFTLNIGTISNNTAANWGGGGVFVTNNGSFTMTGGTISGNTMSGSSGGGGGVAVRDNAVNFTMTGGTIQDNTATTGEGGGVHFVSGSATMHISGSPVISGNTDDNLYLATGKVLTVTGALTENANIGLTTQTAPTEGTSVAVAQGGDSYTLTDTDLARLSSDETGYGLSQAEGQLVLSETVAQRTITFETDGGTQIPPITQDVGTTITPPADPTKDGYVFGGWDPALPETMPENNLTVTATWTAATHTHHEVTFEGTDVLPDAAGSYYLTGDVTLTSTWTAPTGPVDLCLNGHTITLGTNIRISVPAGATLRVYDCGTTGTVTGGSQGNADAGAFTVAGTLELHGGTIRGNSARYGGGVYVGGSNSAFIMDGGTITGNTATHGGGVGIANGGTFEMTGGTITGNSASSYGTGVGVLTVTNTTFNFGGNARITGNTFTGTLAANGNGGDFYLVDGNGARINIVQALGENALIDCIAFRTLPAQGATKEVAAPASDITLTAADAAKLVPASTTGKAITLKDGKLVLGDTPTEPEVPTGLVLEGYTEITSMDDLTYGKYLILTDFDDSYHLLYPAATGNNAANATVLSINSDGTPVLANGGTLAAAHNTISANEDGTTYSITAVSTDGQAYRVVLTAGKQGYQTAGDSAVYVAKEEAGFTFHRESYMHFYNDHFDQSSSNPANGSGHFRLFRLNAVDRTALDAAIAAAEAHTLVEGESANYTNATWTAMTTALDAAKALGTDATQQEIDRAATTLAAAVTGLQAPPQITEPPEGVTVVRDWRDLVPDSGTTQDQPFSVGTGGSDRFRIPAMVVKKYGSNQGRIVTAIDARWNDGHDIYIDTISAYSDNDGETWTYSFPNYFGDSIDRFTDYSTTILDPILLEDKAGTLYLMADMCPAGVATWSGRKFAPAYSNGYEDVNGTQRMVLYTTADPAYQTDTNYSYYIGDFEGDYATVYEAGANGDSRFYVDRYFYLYKQTGDTRVPENDKIFCQRLGDENTWIQQNVFFYNAVLHVRAAVYLCLKTSTDGGVTWSAPQILHNVRRDSELAYLVGPGAGLCIDDGSATGMLLLPTYSHPTERSNFIWSTDGVNWHRSDNASTGSENAVVMINETTVRQFYRSSSNNLQYTDYTYADGAWTPGSNVTLEGVAKKGSAGCQLSAIRYSQLLDGKPVIMVSTPTGGSGSYDREDGKIYVFTLESDNSLTLVNTYDVVDGTGDPYQYSTLAELTNGDVALLYESSVDSSNLVNGVTFTVIPKESLLSEDEPETPEQTGIEIPGYTQVTQIPETGLDPSKYYIVVGQATNGDLYALYAANGCTGVDPGNGVNASQTKIIAQLTVDADTVTAQQVNGAAVDMASLHFILRGQDGTYSFASGDNYLALGGKMFATTETNLTVTMNAATKAFTITGTGASPRFLACNVEGDDTQFVNGGNTFSTNFWGPRSSSGTPLYLFTCDTATAPTPAQNLRDLIAACEALTESDYTAATWASLASTLAEAEEMDLDTATNAAIEEAYDTLSAAKAALQPAVTVTAPTGNTVSDWHTLIPATGTSSGEPFPVGLAGCDDFRIPALITLKNSDEHNGRIVAAIDARWHGKNDGNSPDGGSNDTILSYSDDNGATWHYLFPNYMGDSTDQHNNLASTFIDPILVEGNDGTIYLMADIVPGAVTTAGFVYQPDASNGFVTIGGKERMVLYTTVDPADQTETNYSYYIGDFAGGYAPVLDALSGDDSGFYVDEYYYLYRQTGDARVPESDKIYCQRIGDTNTWVQQNVFFYNASLHVRSATFLWLVKSSDGGETWSKPQIIANVHDDSDRAFLVGPGGGLCLDDGTIMLPCYIWNGNQQSQRACFIWSRDGVNWTRSGYATTSDSSENAVVQINEDTVRMFYRNGSNELHYVDFTLQDGNWQAGTPVDTDLAKRGGNGCQISAINYSGTVDGRPVILVSTPSNTGNRFDGVIYAFKVEEDLTLSCFNTYEIGTQAPFEDAKYAYSSMDELPSGNIALLYEATQDVAHFMVISHEDVVPGAELSQPDTQDHTHDGVVFTAWDDATALPTTPGNYYLTTDVTLAEEYTFPADGSISLCLNGHKIDLHYKHIEVPTGATLNLYDCNRTNGSYNFTPTAGLWVLNEEGTETVTGGIITGGQNDDGSGGGGAIRVRGTLNIHGGTIVGNEAVQWCSGGGVIADGGHITMYGGAIIGNRGGTAAGGGVFVRSNGSFTMHGGTIAHNTSKNYGGGGIYLDNNSTATMTGGTIRNNTSDGTQTGDSGGGAVAIAKATATFTITGGTITGNTSSSVGGGLWVMGTLNISGNPVISGNVGSDVYLIDNKTMTLTGALTEGASIGVTTATAPTVSAPITVAVGGTGYTPTDSDAAHVIPASTDYAVTLTEDHLDLTVPVVTHTITFDTGGGTPATIDPITQEVGTTITAPTAPTREGFVFGGWDPALPATMPNEDMTLTAIWHQLDPEHKHDDLDFTPWTKIDSLPTSPGSYYLVVDVVLTDRWNCTNGSVDLCLNGHSITLGQNERGESAYINIVRGRILNIYDCDTTTVHKFAQNGDKLWVMTDTGTYSVTGGVITGGNRTSTSNRTVGGGAIYVQSTATLNLYGGNIVGNQAARNGGGVFVAEDATFKMSGGAIIGNITNAAPANDDIWLDGGGGGVAVDGGTFNMSGGVIRNNYAHTAFDSAIIDGRGGGVLVFNGNSNYDTHFNMTGGVIRNNTGAGAGGGVYLDDTTNPEYVFFNMSGGEISSNTGMTSAGKDGDGVHVSPGTVFTVSGSPVVSNNNSYDIYLPQGAIIHMDGQLTTGCNLEISPYTRSGVLTSGYEDSGNTAAELRYLHFDKGCIYIRDSEVNLGHEYTFTAEGNILTAACDHCSGSLVYTVTVNDRFDGKKDDTLTYCGKRAIASISTSANKLTDNLSGTYYKTAYFQQTEDGEWVSLEKAPTAIGNYRVDVYDPDTPNEAASVAFEIVPPVVSQRGTLTYNGSAQSIRVNLATQDCVRYYYSTDGGVTYDSTNAIPKFTDAGTYTVYFKATPGSNIPGVEDTTPYIGTFTVTVNPKAQDPAEPTVNYFDETLTAAQDTELATSNTATEGSAQLDLSELLQVSQDLTLYYRSSGNYTSDWVAVTVPGRPASPQASDVTITNETSKGQSDGTIQIPASMEYEDAEGAWHAGPVTGLGANEGVRVRLAATESSFASLPVTFTTGEGPGLTVSFETNNGTAVTAIDNLSYGSLITPDATTKTGYTFAGWFRNEELTQGWDLETDTVTENITLYAKWLLNPATVTTQPQDAETPYLQGVTLTVAVEQFDHLAYTYQWYARSQEQNTVIPDAIDASYTTPADNDAGSYTYFCVVTVSDENSARMYTTTDAATVTVLKLDPQVTWPDPFSIHTGSKLSDISLDTGFVWDDPDTVVTYGAHSYPMSYIPEDRTNYNELHQDIQVTGLDVTAPTGEISVGQNKWSEFTTAPSFDLFFREAQEVTLTAADEESGVAGIYYHLAKAEVTDFTDVTWTAYEGKLEIATDGEFIIYAKLVDNDGNETVISSNGLVIDTVKPVISGIAEGKGYFGTVEVTVEDENLAQVTVNGQEATLTGNKLTLKPAQGGVKLVVTDQAGNEAGCTVSVYELPALTGQSQSGETVYDKGVTLSVQLEHDEALTYAYQWYAVGQEQDAPIDGATAASYTTPAKNTVGSYGYYCVVTVTDGTGATATVTSDKIQLVVNPADPEVTWPAASSIPMGSKLSDIALGTGFAWNDPDTVVAYGTHSYPVTYTPADTKNYNVLHRQIQITGLDVTAPTGQIALGQNRWNKLTTAPSFDLFFREAQEVTILGADAESGVDGIYYHLAKGEVKDFTDVTWIPYEGKFKIAANGEFVIYAKVVDLDGNETIISSNGLVIDTTKPVISGIEDGKTYCGGVEVTVTDQNLAQVTVNGKEVTLTGGKLTLEPSQVEIQLAVTDKAGNETRCTVTVNETHNPAAWGQWKDNTVTTTCQCGETFTLTVQEVGIATGQIVQGLREEVVQSQTSLKLVATQGISHTAMEAGKQEGESVKLMDISLYDLATGTKVTETTQVLQIPIACDLTGKKDVRIQRIHGEQITTLTKLDAKPTQPKDNTWFYDEDAEILYIYSSQFSVYGVFYQTPAKPTTPTTGDGVFLWIGLMVLSCVSLGAVYITGKKKAVR